MGIYVETLISCSIDELWDKTQTPELHERWDLRFTEICYLPRPDPDLPQQFAYKTRLGFGVEIAGMGETVGTHVNARQRTSALKFWSDDPKSLIRTGSGYWKYEQCADGVRFITGYDYDTRFGRIGSAFDRLIFRPLIGWATAWSFDRLRLWIEKGIDPAVSLNRSLIHALVRLTLVFVWLYQGLVPKLLALHPDEVSMMRAAGVPLDLAPLAVRVFGLIEVAFALVLLVMWTRRRVLLLHIPLMIGATMGVALAVPDYLIAAFNPITLNILVLVLALIGYMSSTDLPSASHCIRREKSS
jgi:hypothetical protein